MRLGRDNVRGPQRVAARLPMLGAAILSTVAFADPVASPSQTPLPAVVVSGDRLPVENLIDRKVYTITADLQSSFGTVTDVLTAIPSVEVDADGIVALRGDTSVLILLDGKPLAQLSGASAGDNLQQIPADDIERIEVLTTPPAQYRAEGAGGVINIITRRKHQTGWSETLQASLGNNGRSVAGSRVGYQTDVLALFGSFNLRQDDKQRVITSSPVVTDPISGRVTASSNTLTEDIRRRIPLGKLGLNYRLDDRRTIDLSITRGGRSGARNFVADSESEMLGGLPDMSSSRRSVGSEWSMDSDQRLSFEQRFDRTGELLTVMLHRSTFYERERYNYVTYSVIPAAAPTADDLRLSEDHDTVDVSADYVLPMNADRTMRIGYSSEQSNNTFGYAGDFLDSAGVPTPNPTITDNFFFRQVVNAGYGSWQQRWMLWTALVGLRAEYTRTDARQLTDLIAFQRDYFHVYPSLHIDRVIDDQATLSFSASRRIARPDPSAFDPYVDRQDVQNLRAGNPSLLPQDTQSYEVGYTREMAGMTVSATAYLRHNHNSVTDVTQYIGPDVTLATKANLPRNDADGVELSSNGRLTSGVSYSLNLNAFHSEIDATPLGFSGLRSTSGVNVKASLDDHLTSADTAQIYLTRSDKRLTPQGYVDAIYQVNVGYRRQLAGGLTLVATVSDLFNSQTYRRVAETPAFTDIYQRHVKGRIAYLGVVYAVGAAKKPKAPAFDYDQ